MTARPPKAWARALSLFGALLVLLLGVSPLRAAMAETVVSSPATHVPAIAPASLAADRAPGSDLTPPHPTEPPTEPPRTGEAPEAEGGMLGSTLSALLRMVLVLAGVVLLAYLLLHKGLGSLSGRLTKGRLVRIVDRVGLEPKKVLYVVEVAGHYYLLGTSEQGVSCLATLGGDETRLAFDEALADKAKSSAPAQEGGSHGEA